MTETTQPITITANSEVGQVRFFDHKKGFGFVDVLNSESDHFGEEVFFHFSEIKCESSFKKVIPGEMVSFNITPKVGDESKVLCTNIRGVFNATMLVDNESFVYKVSNKRNFSRADDRDRDNVDSD